MEIISRDDAQNSGLKFFFTGVACRFGHLVQRYVCDGSCIECRNIHSEKWRKANPEKARESVRRWANRNIESERERSKAKRLKNPEAHRAMAARWSKANPEKMSEYWRRSYESPKNKASKFMRNSVVRTLRGRTKDKRSQELLGYTRSELVAHIEKQFTAGMSWENHGEVWHIDHIIPLSKLIDDGETDPKVINALSNLRPLCALENIKKNDDVLTLL